ncbi:MAG: STAS domain-containing protein [Deltaproteobacteria bacterium]|nr:STAS domain-containing protein [Deltaproteobacteria bacterium]MBI2974231.1 STAS domain-containing protein [Deltaproteobacteria bacterium]
MEISVEELNGVSVMRCLGSLDADTVALFRKRGAELFEKGCRKFIVDVSSVSFIDSMGLGAMISLLRKTREKGGDVKLCGINKEIKEIFEITRLNKLFEVCADIETAHKKFA